ncbi:hypothetical protein, partial [Dickeya dadantii]|uniref:hypothetical protein n=1 Tax=Dickeya dadantii TaxID=204038 RepID=UPI0020A640C1
RHTVMPDRLYWLQVSTRQGIGEYAGCLHVATHVVRAVRQWPDGQPPDDEPTPPAAASGWRALNPPAGLGAISLMMPSPARAAGIHPAVPATAERTVAPQRTGVDRLGL